MLKNIWICLLMLGFLGVVSAQETDEMQAGDTRIDDYDVSQVYVPAGCFMMGTSDEEADYARTLDAPSWSLGRLSSERPQHEVCITQDYWIDEFEVSNQSFQEFIDDDGYTTESYWSKSGWKWLSKQSIDDLLDQCADLNEPDHPRVCVTWYQAEAYATWRGGRLLTEAEWEYAARGSNSFIYPWGNDWDTAKANIEESEGTTAIGTYPEGISWVGAQDMVGNAMEWVADWLSKNYDNSLAQVDDPTGPDSGLIKVEKGGWWGSNSVVGRSAYRHFEDPPTYQDHHIGFRIMTPIDDSE